MGTYVRLHICGDIRHLLDGIGRLGCQVVNIDFLAPLAAAREAMGPRQALLGNIDPVRVLRNGSPASITAALEACRREAGDRYIVAAGCEVTRDTPPENLRAMTDFARSSAG